MSEKKLLSLCMITKNDEEYLFGCLRNLKEIVDEIIIADIGSGDNTVRIGEQEGAQVYPVVWNNNFSEVKNFCLDHAKGRWVLFLQANETIDAEKRTELLALLDNPNVEGYLMFVDYNSEEFGIVSPVQSLRLFRNRKEYRFRYGSFESVPFDILGNIKDSKIQIKQDTDAMLSWELTTRIVLLQEEASQHEDDCYLQYMAGIILLNQQKWDECIECFQKARKTINFGYLFAPHLYKCLSWAYLYLEQYRDAMDILNEGIEYLSFYTDLFILRGELHNQQKHYHDAIQDLEFCLRIREQPNLTVPESEIDNSVIFETLGEIYEKNLSYRRALACYRDAYELNPAGEDLLHKIISLAQTTGSIEAIEDLLPCATEEEDPDRLLALMEILIGQREYSLIQAHIDDFEAMIGENDQTRLIRFYCQIMLGDMPDNYFDIAAKSLFYPEALLKHIEFCWANDDRLEAERLLLELERMEDADLQILSFYRFIHGLLQGNESSQKTLTEQEYEITGGLYGDLLWLKKEKQALILLPLLLQEKDDSRCISLAEPWAETGNFEVIQLIFSYLSDQDKKAEFKQKMIELLLRHDHVKTAIRVKNASCLQLPGELETVLWARGMMLILQDRMNDAKRMADGTDTIQDCSYTPTDNKLLEFCQSLCKINSNLDNNTNVAFSEKSVTAEVHEKIGDIYLKTSKKTEALSAYLKGLQWDPLNENLQKKIKKLFDDGSERARDLLEKKEWSLEGGWFDQKQAFIDFVYGMIDFKNGEFDGAIASLSKIKGTKEGCFLFKAYVTSTLLILGKEEEVRSDEENSALNMITTVYRICKDYVLGKLNESSLQYPYCELIGIEEEKIQKLAE